MKESTQVIFGAIALTGLVFMDAWLFVPGVIGIMIIEIYAEYKNNE